MFSDQVADNIVNNILRQMGATKIKTMPGYINIVTFALSEDFVVQYVYEMKENETIYLQRVTPYEHFIGEPENTDALVAAIKEDLDSYKRAFDSSNFELFLKLADKAEKAKEIRERLFLSDKYADQVDLVKVDAALDKVLAALEDAEKNLCDGDRKVSE